ncbi:hypothetical protein [Nocardia altamirensis]|uniref:hypothetical protein n=1 Tax=Nocardia altamirensis TaxID=472158 RepID=UPI0014355D31|nr:hypothetical protein [Nocardia altamirensis]
MWYVIRGRCRMLGPDGSVRHRLGDNDLALVPPGVEVKLSATDITHLLAIVTLSDTVARSLPPRLPCMEFPADEPLGRDIVR